MKSDFEKRYNDLEERFDHRVELDRIKYPGLDSVFLPNIPPISPVDFVFIGMEPSYNKWAKDRKDAKHKIDSGYRNFMYSLEDFIMHYYIRRYLYSNGTRYYITDLSKGAINTQKANYKREERYQDWYPLLKDELSLVAKKTAKIIAIGQKVKNFLDKQRHQPAPRYFPHYSNQNNKWRNEYIVANKKGRDFEKFCDNDVPSRQDILREARDMMIEWKIPRQIIDSTIQRLNKNKSDFTDSRYKLLFVCADIFQQISKS